MPSKRFMHLAGKHYTIIDDIVCVMIWLEAKILDHLIEINVKCKDITQEGQPFNGKVAYVDRSILPYLKLKYG